METSLSQQSHESPTEQVNAQKEAQKSLSAAALIKACQGVIALACLSAMQTDGVTRSEAEKQKYMFDRYHGKLNADGSVQYISMKQQFLDGEGPFAHIMMTAENGERRLVLAFVNGASYVPADLTLKALSAGTQTKPDLIIGRAIHDAANTHLREAKKCVAVLRALFPDGNAASGHNEWDLLRQVREKYIKDYFEPAARKVVDVEVEAYSRIRAPPVLPVGWSAFVAFGPRSPCPLDCLNYLLDDVSGGNEEKKSTKSRATLRLEQAASADAERASGNSNGIAGARGITVGGSLRDFKGFKSKFATVAFNVTVNHRRRILYSTKGHPGRYNDKTLQLFDDLFCGLHDGTFLGVRESSFSLLALSSCLRA